MTLERLTPHQATTLRALAKKATVLANGRPGRWILDKDCGGPAALEHLFRKGYVMRDLRTGPRGGEHAYYRPNEAGYAAFDKMTDATYDAVREMPTAEIDRILIDARDHGKIVRVYVGPKQHEVRGIPGQAVRDPGDGRLRIPIGMRRVALHAITKVVV